MTDDVFLNTYHNASTPPAPDVPGEQARFMLAADPILAQAAELARVITRAHQGAATQLVGEGWAHARKFFSLSEKYAAWSDYRAPTTGVGIHAFAHQIEKPLRLTDAELRAHPEWRNFSDQLANHPPMRGWLVTPLIGSDGLNYGFIQVSDRLEGDFTQQDEANLVRLAALTSTALDALWHVHVPGNREKALLKSQRKGAEHENRSHRRDRAVNDNEFRLSDVPPGSSLLVGKAAVFNVDGKLCATQNECTHRQGPLNEGKLEGSTVTCPLHGSQFDVSTGAVLRGPATEPLEIYTVVVEGDVGRIDGS